MTWEHDSVAEQPSSSPKRSETGQEASPPTLAAAPPAFTNESADHGFPGPEITVGKRWANVAGKEIEVFTMHLGSETIDLLPLKTWAQLDLYKWRVRGVLPGTPAGLEIGFDHAKLMGHTVVPTDPEACAKLEKLFSEWLAMEKESLAAAKRKVQLKATNAAAQRLAPSPEESAIRFRVALDKESQVHVQCVKGKEILATIGLNVPGFQSLINQGWMRKPHSLKTGALHDWVELDGTLYSFEKGSDSSVQLAQALNEAYLPAATLGKAKEVVVYSNAASPTGFDIQFPAKVGGVMDNRRRPLGEESLALLQDEDHCGLVRKGRVIKVSRPYFIFKQKTADGGESYLEKCAENLVKLCDDDGGEKLIDLAQPLNYMHLSAVELTAVFNHPAINRHADAAPPEPAQAPISKPCPGPPALPKPEHKTSPPPQTSPVTPAAAIASAPPRGKEPAAEVSAPRMVPASPASAPVNIARATTPIAPPPPSEPLPNLWLKPVLEQQPIRFDWFTCLVYAKMATWVGNSNQGRLLESECWYIRLAEATDLADPGFRGIFDTRGGSFGFLSGGYMIRFENGTAFLGPANLALMAKDVRPLAVGMDSSGCPVFVVNDGYRSKFGVPEPELRAKLVELKTRGGKLMSVKEVLESREALEVIWTVPAQQADANNPEAQEQLQP